MKTYTIPASTLKASLYCAAKQDVRFYLNGVYLDAPKGRVVTTDGHMLFCCSALSDNHGDAKDFPAIIIPREAIERALKGLTKRLLQTSAISVSEDNGKYSLATINGDVISFTPVDGRFPEYERVIRTDASGEIAQFNSDLLADCQLALQTYAQQPRAYTFLAHNGNTGAVYSITGVDALCIVMPMRCESGSDMEWYTGKPSMQEAA